MTTRPHQNGLLKMKLHDLNCMKYRVMWWRDVVSCAGCACSCSTDDHKCPVTVKTHIILLIGQGTTSLILVLNTLAGQRPGHPGVTKLRLVSKLAMHLES